MSRTPHPAVYAVLYYPFGALGGFISVALTFLATKHGLSIAEGALFTAAMLLINYLKWMWAPLVDLTLTPRQWYLLSVLGSAVGALALAAIPLSPENLPLLIAVVIAASVVNSIVGMAVEAILAVSTPPQLRGQASGWFQLGNLGGTGLGGGVGLLLLERLPELWMSGAILGGSFLLCAAFLPLLPQSLAPTPREKLGAATRGLFRDLRDLVRSANGRRACVIFFLPVGTGTAIGVMSQAEVAARWGAGADAVALVQGMGSGLATALGCLAGGWLCSRLRPLTAYWGIGILLGALALGAAATPYSLSAYIGWSFAYNTGVGLAYAAFTALVLDAMGPGSAATKYTLYASLSNFPIWWMGLLLAWIAQGWGPRAMLVCEALIGVAAVAGFLLYARRPARGTAESTPAPAPKA